MPAQPTQLVRVTLNGQIQLTQDGKDILESDNFQKKQLAVVAVVGPAREGKSTLINLLLRQYGVENPNFVTSPGVDSCTGGIWMWSNPIELQGQRHSLVILDAEGVQNTDRNTEACQAVYCLAYLLSSMFVWNKKGIIDISSLQQLAILKSSTAIIKTRASDTDGASSNRSGLMGGIKKTAAALQKQVHNAVSHLNVNDDTERGADQENVMPAQSSTSSSYANQRMRDLAGCVEASLLWVIRDSLDMRPDETPIMMLNRILDNPSAITAPAERDACKAISILFPRMRRNCIGICEPDLPRQKKKNISAVPWAELDQEFKEGMQKVAAGVADAQPLSTHEGCPVTGALLLRMLEIYIRTINGRGIIDLEGAQRQAMEQQSYWIKTNIERSFEHKLGVYRRMEITNGKQLLDIELALNNDINELVDEFHKYVSFVDWGDKDRLGQRLQESLISKMGMEMRLIKRSFDVKQMEMGKRLAQVEQDCLELIRGKGRGLQDDASVMRDRRAMQAVFDETVRAACCQHLDRLLDSGIITSDQKKELLQSKLDRELERQSSFVWASQDSINRTLEAQLDSSLTHWRDSNDGGILFIQADGKLKAAGPQAAAVEYSTTFALVNVSGEVLLYPPGEGQIVAMFCPKEGKVVTASLDNKAYWMWQARHRVWSTSWTVGQPLPDSALFKVHKSGNYYSFYSIHVQGWVSREVQLNWQQMLMNQVSAPHKVVSEQANASMWRRVTQLNNGNDSKDVAKSVLLQLVRRGISLALVAAV